MGKFLPGGSGVNCNVVCVFHYLLSFHSFTYNLLSVNGGDRPADLENTWYFVPTIRLLSELCRNIDDSLGWISVVSHDLQIHCACGLSSYLVEHYIYING